MQKNEKQQSPTVDQDAMSCYLKWNEISHFSRLCFCTCVCVFAYECVREPANEKEREKIWWIVSYVASISSPVIFGVNNRVYSQACSAVVFLFVVGWQKYYSQTSHLLYPILIQKSINPIHTRICTIWHYGQDCVYICAHIPSKLWLFFAQAYTS